MSKNEKSKDFLKKTRRSHFVTRMLSFSKRCEKKCDDNFYIFAEKYLGVIYVVII